MFLRALLACVLVAACGSGTEDPRTIRGALAAAAQALDAQDAQKLFRLIDQRARHAMASIVVSRVQARRLVEADYPESERAAALAALGDAAQADSAAALFAQRCDAGCMRALAEQVGAPVAEKSLGDEVEVRTARGAVLHMHAGTDHWYGIVWNTSQLSEERARAARDLVAIRDNAAIYRKRRELDQGAR